MGLLARPIFPKEARSCPLLSVKGHFHHICEMTTVLFIVCHFLAPEKAREKLDDLLHISDLVSKRARTPFLSHVGLGAY